MAAPADPNKTQLRLGLEAAKNKDYPVAIAHLRQVKPGPAYEQAQQALVIALSKTGSVENAIARCQPLLNSAKPETRQWAKKSLSKLQTRATPPSPDSEPQPDNHLPPLPRGDRGGSAKHQHQPSNRLCILH